MRIFPQSPGFSRLRKHWRDEQIYIKQVSALLWHTSTFSMIHFPVCNKDASVDTGPCGVERENEMNWLWGNEGWRENSVETVHVRRWECVCVCAHKLMYSKLSLMAQWHVCFPLLLLLGRLLRLLMYCCIGVMLVNTHTQCAPDPPVLLLYSLSLSLSFSIVSLSLSDKPKHVLVSFCLLMS